MQWYNPRAFVLYRFGFTAEQSEVTEAVPLSAEMPRLAGAHGAPIIAPQLFGFLREVSDAAHHNSRWALWDDWAQAACQAWYRWVLHLHPTCLWRGRREWLKLQDPHSLPCRHPPSRRKPSFPGRRIRSLPWALHWGGGWMKNYFLPGHNWRAFPNFPNSLIPHICIQGKNTVVNHDCKARKRVKPWEDTVLVDSSVLRFSAITIPMWEAIKLHSWKINICSRQTKRNQWKHWVGIYTEIWSLSC